MSVSKCVSVVIPAYNYGKFVRDAVDSALAQSSCLSEVIVVDDGSTDDTAAVLEPFRQKIRYIYQKNAGLSAARNTGIRAASADWVAFLDADDVWYSDKLKLQMDCAAHFGDTCVVGAMEESNALRLGGTAKIARRMPLFTRMDTIDLLGAAPFGASSVVAKKDALLRAGLFNEERRSVEDREMWLKLSLQGGVARVNTPLWHYRVHPNQMNANPSRMSVNYAGVLDAFFKENPGLSRHRSYAYGYYCYDSALSYHDANLNTTALTYLLRSFIWHPSPLPQRQAEKAFSRMTTLLKCLLGTRIFNQLANNYRYIRRRKVSTC